MLSDSEKKIVRKIKKSLSPHHKPYDFWFVYDERGKAINWEGGTELRMDLRFRNEYRIEYGKPVKRNWG